MYQLYTSEASYTECGDDLQVVEWSCGGEGGQLLLQLDGVRRDGPAQVT